MSLQTELWSINGLATELGFDRRAMAKMLDELAPDEVNGNGKRWRMRRVLAHLQAQRDGGNGEELDLNQERARLARAQSEKTELEVARIRGELLDAEDTRKAISRLVTDMRTRALAFPTKWAPRLVGLNTAQIKDELERGIYELLGNFADTDTARYLTELGSPGIPPAAKIQRQPVGRRKSHPKPRKRRRARKVAKR